VFFNRYKAKAPESAQGHTFPAIDKPLMERLSRRVRDWISEHIPLFEAVCVAVSAHILAFPLFWFAGWALPWPKSPEILTVIEIDLSHWAELGPVPKKVTDIIKSEMHAAK
jgi:hypothetical protein